MSKKKPVKQKNKEKTKVDAEWISPYSFAKKINVRENTVVQAINTGRFDDSALKKEKYRGRDVWRIHVLLGIEQWDSNKKSTAQISDEEYKNARKRYQVAQAEIEELKAKELAGDLVNAEEIKTVLSASTVRLKDAIFNEVTRLAPLLTDVPEPELIERTLRKAFTKLLEDFANACERRRTGK